VTVAKNHLDTGMLSVMFVVGFAENCGWNFSPFIESENCPTMMMGSDDSSPQQVIESYLFVICNVPSLAITPCPSAIFIH